MEELLIRVLENQRLILAMLPGAGNCQQIQDAEFMTEQLLQKFRQDQYDLYYYRPTNSGTLRII